MLDAMAVPVSGVGGAHALVSAHELVDGGVADAVADHGVPHGRVTIDQFEQLKDGEQRTFRVRAGSYRLQVTATADGAGVTWIGPQCENAKETRVYDSNCILGQDGQLMVSNPTTFGLGATSTVTIKLTPQ